jgi:hypothetical protein
MAPVTRLACSHRHLLQAAKTDAVYWVKSHKRVITAAFHKVLLEKYNLDRRRVDVQWEQAYNRILQATCQRIDDDLWGQTDGAVIELHDRICEHGRCRVIRTLVHEALHNTFVLRRRTRSRRWSLLSTADEHAAMDLLGFC